MHGRGRRSLSASTGFRQTFQNAGELFDFARTIRDKSATEAQGIANKKKGHRVFAIGFQILVVQCLLRHPVCSDVAPSPDLCDFQSLQNGNFSKIGRGYRNLMKKVLVKLNPTKMRLRRGNKSLILQLRRGHTASISGYTYFYSLLFTKWSNQGDKCMDTR